MIFCCFYIYFNLNKKSSNRVFRGEYFTAVRDGMRKFISVPLLLHKKAHYDLSILINVIISVTNVAKAVGSRQN
jgi:hypothetical protein